MAYALSDLSDLGRRNGRKSAFTLIELSIVIVIIGFIVGGVFVGRDLIRAAELHSIVTQYDQFSQAALAFRLKYNCLPGDCPNADKLGLGDDCVAAGQPDNTCSNGNGDGKIGYCNALSSVPCSVYNPGSLFYEFYDFWHHLATAGMIPGNFIGNLSAAAGVLKPGIASPGVKLHPVSSPNRTPIKTNPGGWWVWNEVYFADTPYPYMAGPVSSRQVFSRAFLITNSMTDHSATGGGTASNTFSGYRPHDIEALDRKIDDADPVAGIARAFNTYEAPLPSTIPFLASNAGTCGTGVSAVEEQNCLCSDDGGISPPYRYNIAYVQIAPGPNLIVKGLCGLALSAPF